jgi:hypothetical protein
MCTFVDVAGTVTTSRARNQPVRGRILVVACLLLLSGCSGATSGGSGPTETVTPAPVPSPDGADRTAAPGGPGMENGTVGGRALAERHTESLTVPRRRVVRLRVETVNGTLLSYREDRTITDGASFQRRRYEGPATARFVPDSRNATSARETRYDNGTVATRRQFVDGTEQGGAAPPLAAPTPVDVAALLDGATVVDRTASGGYRVSKRSVVGTVVPGFLTGAREGAVRASIRADGRITRLSVRYDARVGDRRVVVAQAVRWTRPLDRELR